MMRIPHISSQEKGLDKVTPVTLTLQFGSGCLYKNPDKSCKKVHILGLMESMCPEGVINLQYVDDTLLFMKHDLNAACHLKWLMLCFEKLSGMKINYNKSDMTAINLEEDETQDYVKIFCCKVSLFPFKYLGVPLHHKN
jgi:hypothetical protein